MSKRCVFLDASAKKIELKDHLTNRERAVLCLSECVGTAIFVFVGCMSCVHGSQNSPLHIAMTFGLAIMIAVVSVGHISGSHVNPAVSLGALILGHMPLIHFPMYVISQILGSIVGFAIVKGLIPPGTEGGICSPALGVGISTGRGVGVECVLTFVLVFVCGAVWDRRNKLKHDSVPIKFGLVVAALAMAGIHFTGAHMNPARSIGPALLNGTWDDWWVYWVGPLLGALLAGLLYRFIFSKEEDDQERTPEETLRLNEKA